MCLHSYNDTASVNAGVIILDGKSGIKSLNLRHVLAIDHSADSVQDQFGIGCVIHVYYHYFNRLIALNLWDASYSFTTINVKSTSNIPARFQNEYRKALMADLREVQQAFSGAEELESRLRELDERLNAEADEVQEMIATNARVAQNQDEYSTAYDAAVGRYESTKAERDSVAAEIRQKGIRRREFERFITELEKLPDAVTEFDESLWGSMVEYVTVRKDKTMVFTMIGGTEIEA